MTWPGQPVKGSTTRVFYNHVYDNNFPNPAPPESFQGGLPPGIGILLLGVSDHVIRKNYIAGNDLSWAAATN